MQMPLYLAYASFSVAGCLPVFAFFFFNDTATTEIYTLSLHDALPISPLPPAPNRARMAIHSGRDSSATCMSARSSGGADRKSTPPKPSHRQKPYAPFFFEKKKRNNRSHTCPHAHSERTVPSLVLYCPG